MANTTNFGWETPDDTDLVKDGALAMRTLGNAIDTSLVDLKGGTTDQVLAKNSNTDMDFKWVTSDDANAIQNAIVDAKGDLIAASAADTPARLAVGANNTILTADSSTSTGLAWTGNWISYTPTWTATTTNPTIGNGSIAGGYRRIGDNVEFWIKLIGGSTTTAGTGTYRLSLPLTAFDSTYVQGFTVGILDGGVAWYTNYYGQGQRSGLSSSFEMNRMSDQADFTSSSPFTFGNTDSITVQGRYRVA